MTPSYGPLTDEPGVCDYCGKPLPIPRVPHMRRHPACRDEMRRTKDRETQRAKREAKREAKETSEHGT